MTIRYNHILTIASVVLLFGTCTIESKNLVENAWKETKKSKDTISSLQDTFRKSAKQLLNEKFESLETAKIANLTKTVVEIILKNGMNGTIQDNVRKALNYLEAIIDNKNNPNQLYIINIAGFKESEKDKNKLCYSTSETLEKLGKSKGKNKVTDEIVENITNLVKKVKDWLDTLVHDKKIL